MISYFNVILNSQLLFALRLGYTKFQKSVFKKSYSLIARHSIQYYEFQI
jgi:hypothetical protein